MISCRSRLDAYNMVADPPDATIPHNARLIQSSMRDKAFETIQRARAGRARAGPR